MTVVVGAVFATCIVLLAEGHWNTTCCKYYFCNDNSHTPFQLLFQVLYQTRTSRNNPTIVISVFLTYFIAVTIYLLKHWPSVFPSCRLTWDLGLVGHLRVDSSDWRNTVPTAVAASSAAKAIMIRINCDARGSGYPRILVLRIYDTLQWPNTWRSRALCKDLIISGRRSYFGCSERDASAAPD